MYGVWTNSARGLLSSVARGGGVAACVCTLVALGGCGSAVEHTTSSSVTKHTTSARPSGGTAYDDPKVAACIQRNGITVLSNGEWQAAKTVTTAAKRKAIENRCGFGVSKDTRRSGNAAKRLVAEKLPPRTARAKRSQAQRRQPALTRDRLVAKVVACLHREGVSIPPSDSALLSSTDGIKTRSRRAKAAIGKCRSEL